MAQDVRKGQPPVTRGKSPAATVPDTPAAKDMNAPPLPEAPDAPAGAVPPAGRGTASTDAGKEGKLAAATDSETKQLSDKVAKAKLALEAAKEAFARHEAQREADEATATMVSAYEAEVPALEALEKELRQYQTTEISTLEEILPAAARTAIKEVDKAPRKKIDDLFEKIEREERDAAKTRGDLDEARAAAAKARQESEALQHPAASIKDRLKAADAIRSDARKASASGNYALAYWLLRKGGKLDQAIEAGQQTIAPETLATKIKEAAADQAKADQAVEALEARVTKLDAKLQEHRAELATVQRTIDASIFADLATLNPPSAEAA